MRHLLVLLSLLAGVSLSLAVEAQNEDISVFEINDVAVDVTADSAAHARDQAVAQAQRAALGQLLQRLDADASPAAKLDNDDIADLIQNFEVQNERSSAIRYIGTFTVQFKPNAVRALLGARGSNYIETRSKTIVVLPVVVSNGRPVLWEETTKWRAAWEAGSHSKGLVPVVVPSGGLDDIAMISTEEAVMGKAPAFKNMAEKHQGGGVLVATLEGEPEKAGSELKITLQHYDGDGDVLSNTSLTLKVPNEKNPAENILKQGVIKARAQLEKDWKQEVKEKENPVIIEGKPESSVPQTISHLPVVVPIETPAQWAQIKQRLNQVQNINRADIIAFIRGMTKIEIEFRGDLSQLQEDLELQELSLEQDSATGSWILQPLAPEGVF